jgi:hypothetical protein
VEAGQGPSPDSRVGASSTDAALPVADAGVALGASSGSSADAAAVEAAATSTGCASSGKLVGGSEKLIDVFAVEAGIIVVRSDAILLVGRDRVVKKTYSAPRIITATAFDGTYLAAADAAKLVVLDPALNVLGEVALIESCAAAVIVNDGVFVCGPGNDWDRIFYTYDLKTRTLLRKAARKYTYNGIPMRRVPGTNDFVTVTVSTSPSDFHLYRVDASGETTFVNESPYHGDFPATTVFAFAGTPVTHVVNLDGLLLSLAAPACSTAGNAFMNGCFVKDGNLGTLWMQERFVALGNDAQGGLYGVVAKPGSPFNDSPCAGGCAVQRIDVERRTVLHQKTHALIGARRFVTLAADPGCRMVAVGYDLAAPQSLFETRGHQVDLLDYGAP